MKRVVACLFAFGLLFLSETLEATACQTNVDCVLVSADCCGCSQYGKSTAIHRSQEADYYKSLNQYCTSQLSSCSLATICHRIQVRCENSRCVAIGPKTVSLEDAVINMGNSPGTVTPLPNPGVDNDVAEKTPIDQIQAIQKENQERIDSATKKIDKQRKFLGFSALANVAVGVYLLNKQCNPTPYAKYTAGDFQTKCGIQAGGPPGTVAATALAAASTAHLAGKLNCGFAMGNMIGGPPNTVHGCVMGPLALAQGLMHFKQRQSLKRTRQKLEGVNTGIDGSMLYAGNVDGAEGNTGNPIDGGPSYPKPASLDENEPFHIPDLEIPCPNDPTQTCQLTNNGETIVPVNGGPPQSVSEIAANLPTSSEDSVVQADIEARMQALEDAVKANQELIAQANEYNSDPTANNPLIPNPNSEDDSQSVVENTAPAFNFDPLGTSSGDGSVKGAGSISGLSGFEDGGGNTPELSAPPEGVYGSGGGDSLGAGSFAGNVEVMDEDGLSGADAGNTQFSPWGRRTISGSGDQSSSDKTLPFGTDTVATADVNIFGAVQNRYQEFRDRGQFIPPSTSGAVVTPTIPAAAE